MAIKHFLGELESMTPAEAKEFLDLRAQYMKDRIIEAPDYQPKNERVIYVSNDGSDDNDGLTPETAIATAAKVNEITRPGDTVLFRRGDHFRGVAIEVNKDNVTYAAYGTGVKPILDTSPKNFADPDLWEKSEYENVWHLKETQPNVGLIHINPEYTYGRYDELYATMKVPGLDGFTGVADLKNDLEYCSDFDTGEMYFYSEQNPGERFYDLEFGIGRCTFRGSASNVLIDNLWMTHAGQHSVSMGTVTGRRFTNCVFSWVGGSLLTKSFYGGAPVRFGNAIEVYGGCDGYSVENCWMYQIYDTAITHQCNKGSANDTKQENILYKDNLIEYCFWFIEYYNHPEPVGQKYTKDTYMTGNFCRMGGWGWGCHGRERGVPMLHGSHMCDNVENFVVENNIFYQSKGILIMLDDEGHKKEIFRNNVYVNPKGERFLLLYGTNYILGDDAKDVLREMLHEDEPTVVYMPRPKVKVHW